MDSGQRDGEYIRLMPPTVPADMEKWAAREVERHRLGEVVCPGRPERPAAIEIFDLLYAGRELESLQDKADWLEDVGPLAARRARHSTEQPCAGGRKDRAAACAVSASSIPFPRMA